MNCDRIAKAYRWLEYLRFGKALERCRYAMLPELRQSQYALVLGDGDGRFLSKLAAANPELSIDAMELSRNMIQLTARRISALVPSHRRRIRLYRADARTAELPQNKFDLVATHFFFDVFSSIELSLLMKRLSPSLACNARWVISEFDLPSRGLARFWSKLWIRAMYKLFRITTGLSNQQLPDWRALLRQAGFTPQRQIAFRKGFIVSELWERKH